MIDWDNIRAGISSDALEPQAVHALDERVRRFYPATRNLMLIHKGKLVLTRTYDQNISLTEKKLVRSITKSVVSCLIGIALEQRKIKSTDQTLSQLLPTSAGCAAGMAAGKLTLHQLLSMTGGMRWPMARSGIEPMHVRFMRSKDWIESIIKNPIIHKNHGDFQYNTGSSHLLSAIISAATGMSAAQYASNTLFKALALEDFNWPEDPQGISYGGWGLEISCIDMAKFGMLYLGNGQFEGQRVLSPEWVSRSTQAHTMGYGYQWWLYNLNGSSAFAAVGLGGKTIAVVPESEVVIVLTSGLAGRSRNQIDLLRSHVFPLVSS